MITSSNDRGGKAEDRKVALATGGTKGIDRGVAMMLLKKGYYVIVTYAHDKESAEAFANKASNVSKSFNVCKIDQTDRLQTYAFIDSLKESGLKLDCIICNAGITRRSSFTSTSNADWDDMMEVAVNSHYIIIRELFHQINPNSRIVFTASTLALYPHASVLGYGVSKSGVVALTKGLMKKFDGTGTTINAVAPGFVDTEWQKKKPQEIRNNICKKTDLHKFATVDEVVDGYRFCIDNGYVNGSVIEINGGYSYK